MPVPTRALTIPASVTQSPPIHAPVSAPPPRQGMLSEHQAPALGPSQPHHAPRTSSLHSTLHRLVPHAASAQRARCKNGDSANASAAKP
eukprot:15440537-Alexandrium_andersonii.AAC.1